ncbi:aldo/keto reductase [Epilithonimonas ginsengisoli]|uniref:Aldo/keto reductase n=1 Tax=Epilithonimonas ginsengisoli TaxID=1245592 RepID=A0ABU4JLT9_9FLAO|nr:MULTISPECIES: aldo/keto reductase [Chryseobacterium group]MBV6881650.1 aldo/keto reductase [Epilithonimonas sp. FP105]MDW8550658.1 aldo/keto reductase [Epilithonimonas ginsengisoli]OAH70939.1 aldo/keto reductase [Chryseobacterium sp. FP211-J200]
MEYRKLGHSDLKVSAITFGAWAAGGWMWGSTDRNEAIEAIRACYDVGVTSIDTAPIYGQGTSEEIVGEAIKNISRDKVQILTKFGMRWDLDKGTLAMNSKNNDGKDIDIYKYAGKESIIFECEQSLKRLGTDYIDLYQIHWPDVTTPIDETFEAVSRLIEQGKVRFAGVCNYDAQQMAEAEKTLKLVSNQIPFSMVNRGIEEETVPYCIENNKSILAYSPLERGLLTGKITPDYKFQDGDHRANLPHFQPEFIQKTNQLLDKIKPIADEHNASLGQLVLRWTIERPGMTIALAGARNAEQAVQNAKSMDIKLSKDEIKTIDDLVNAF